jgi:AhpD family alkylhydroperoxidase
MPPALTPEAVREYAVEKYGFVPNQITVLNQHSPAAAKAYMTIMDATEQSVLEADEREVVILAVSRYNDCHYCTRTHAFLGLDAGLDEDTVMAIHKGRLPEDERYRALVHATRLVLDKQGWLSEEDRAALQEQGLGTAELYEINALIGAKIFSNYVNHIAQTEVDSVVTDNKDIQSIWPVLGKMDW